jgi:hypothetical protein
MNSSENYHFDSLERKILLPKLEAAKSFQVLNLELNLDRCSIFNAIEMLKNIMI